MIIKNKTSIYIASPLGFSESGRMFLYESIIPQCKAANFEIIDPWKLTEQECIDSVITMAPCFEKQEAYKKLNKLIGENNIKGIQKCSALVAVLDGSDVDSGTASEIGYAYALKKPIIGYRNDFRLAGDNEGSIVNLQVEFFILDSGGSIVTTVADIIRDIRRIFPNNNN